METLQECGKLVPLAGCRLISAHVVGIASDMRIGFGEDQFSEARRGKGAGLFGFGNGQRWEIVKDCLTVGFLRGFLTYPLQFRTILPITSRKKNLLTPNI